MFSANANGATLKGLSSVLVRFQSNEDCNNAKRFFDGQLVSREQWGFVLGIHRVTIYRWEKEIIEPDSKLSLLFYKSKNNKSDGLDGYQRFFIAFILLLKAGLVTNRQMTNKEITNYLLEKENGSPRWIKFSRNKFNNWIGAN